MFMNDFSSSLCCKRTTVLEWVVIVCISSESLHNTYRTCIFSLSLSLSLRLIFVCLMLCCYNSLSLAECMFWMSVYKTWNEKKNWMFNAMLFLLFYLPDCDSKQQNTFTFLFKFFFWGERKEKSERERGRKRFEPILRL